MDLVPASYDGFNDQSSKVFVKFNGVAFRVWESLFVAIGVEF